MKINRIALAVSMLVFGSVLVFPSEDELKTAEFRQDKWGYSLGSGRYVIYGTLKLTEGQVLRGQGSRRTRIEIISAGASPAIEMGRGSAVEGISLVGLGETNSVGISVVSVWRYLIRDVDVSWFHDNILIRNSVSGKMEDVRSTDGINGLHLSGTVTDMRFEGSNYIRVNKFGILIDSDKMESWGHPHLTVYLMGGVIEANYGAGIYFNAEAWGLHINNIHFETNGPTGEGPDINLRHGVIGLLNIRQNEFYVSGSKTNIFANTFVRGGEIAGNLFQGENPIVISAVNTNGTLNIHDNVTLKPGMVVVRRVPNQ